MGIGNPMCNYEYQHLIWHLKKKTNTFFYLRTVTTLWCLYIICYLFYVRRVQLWSSCNFLLPSVCIYKLQVTTVTSSVIQLFCFHVPRSSLESVFQCYVGDRLMCLTAYFTKQISRNLKDRQIWVMRFWVSNLNLTNGT